MARDDENEGPDDGPSFLREYGDEGTDPLIILGEDVISALTPAQHKFLLARMVVATDATAARRASIKYDTVFAWKKELAFRKAYDVIRGDPINFAVTVAKNIVAKAAVEHMSLLNHPNIRVRQWTIDLAYRNQGVGQDKGQTNNNYIIGTTTWEQLKELSKLTPVEVNDADARTLPEPADGDYRTLGDDLDAGRVAEVRAESEVLPQ